jgi:uncharacterized protein (TIGR02300 family)
MGLKGFDTSLTLWHVSAILSISMIKGGVMPKEEWGVKRVCPTTGKRFYDLNKNPIVSPYTGDVVTLDTGKGSRTLVADKADKLATKKDAAEDAEEVVLEDDDDLVLDDDADVDLDDDDVLEDDDDTETVALDDLADVAANDGDDD